MEHQRLLHHHNAPSHLVSKHTVTIQRHYRGFKGRQEYSNALWKKMQEEERERLEKQNRQVEEGYMLVELKKEQRERDDQAMLSNTRSFKVEQSGEAPAARIIQRWVRKTLNRSHFIVNTENFLKKQVGIIDRNDLAYTIITAMKKSSANNRKKLKSLRNIFQSMNINGDGQLSKEKFTQGLKIVFNNSTNTNNNYMNDDEEFYFTEEHISTVVEAFTTRIHNYNHFDDENMMIDYDMFLYYLEYDTTSSVQSKLSSYFKKLHKEEGTTLYDFFSIFDENGDGLVSHEEFVHAIHSLKLGITDLEIKHLSHKYDSNVNGMFDYSNLAEHIDNDNINNNKRRSRFHNFHSNNSYDDEMMMMMDDDEKIVLPTAYELQADILAYWKELVRQKDATIHKKLMRDFSRSSMENMAKTDYNSPQKIIEMEMMFDSSDDDDDENNINNKLFSTLNMQEPSMADTDLSSIADENWYEDAVPWNHYMIKSRGQKNEQKEEDSRSNNQYYNTESKIDGSSIGGSGNKEQAEKVEEKYENSNTNTHSSTLDNDINTQKKEKEEEEKQQLEENKNLLANTVRKYINEIEELKAEKSQLMTSFLTTKRELENQTKLYNNLKYERNASSSDLQQAGIEQMKKQQEREIENLNHIHETKIKELKNKHQVDTQNIVNKHLNEVTSLKETIEQLAGRNKSLQHQLDHQVNNLEYTHKHDNEVMNELNKEIETLQMKNTNMEKELAEQRKSNNNHAFLQAENIALKEEKEEANKNIFKQMETLNEIMKNMETLTTLKNHAEEGKQKADAKIVQLEAELRLMHRRSQTANASKVQETLVLRNNNPINNNQTNNGYHSNNNYNNNNATNLYAQKKVRSPPKKNADAQLENLKRNLMKTIVKNGIFRTEELNFLFRSTLEFTNLEKVKVKDMIKQLRVELDLHNNNNGNRNNFSSSSSKSKYIVGRNNGGSGRRKK